MKKLILVLLGVVVLGTGLSARGQSEQIVFYSLKGPSAVGAVQLFETPPLVNSSQLAVQALASVDLMVAKLVSGEAQLGTLPPNIAAKLAASGYPLQIVAVVGGGMLQLLSTDPSIKTIPALQGQMIEVAGQGATPEFVLRRILQNYGLNSELDVQLGFSLPYPESAQALAAERIKLALLPEPFATMARLANPAVTAVSDIQKEWALATGVDEYPMTVVVVNRCLTDSKPAVVNDLLAAYEASLDWVVANPGPAGLLAEKHDLGLKAMVAEQAIPRSAYVFRTAAEAATSLNLLFQAFMEFAPAAIGGKMPDNDLYYSP